MRTIWKYNIPESGLFALDLPKHGKILSVQVQRDVPVIWVEYDTNDETRTREFVVEMTGLGLSEPPGTYIGTFQLDDGAYIGHLYER